jgi:formate-dependent nitrite reductase membrane component NrfD
MNNYLPTLLFVTYGIAMIVLAGLINKEMNQENVSDQFVLSQQVILSLGSMSLAFGLLLGVLVNRNMLQEDKKVCLARISIVLGALLTVSLLVSVGLMLKETTSDELKDSKLRKVVLYGFGLVGLSLIIHGVALFMLRSGKKNRLPSSSSPFLDIE